MTSRSSQELLQRRGSNNSLNGTNVPSPASNVRKTEMKVSDLLRYLPQIRKAGMVHADQIRPWSEHLFSRTTIGGVDKRGLRLCRLTRKLGETKGAQNEGSSKIYDETMYEIVKEGSLLQIRELNKKFTVHDLVQDGKPKDLSAVGIDGEAGRDTDVILICLEGFWDMILRTIKESITDSPQWKSDEAQFWRYAFGEGTNPKSQSMDFFAIAKWSTGPKVGSHPTGDWLMTIVQDKHGLLGSTAQSLTSMSTITKVVNRHANVQLLANCLAQQKFATEGMTTINDFLLVRLKIYYPRILYMKLKKLNLVLDAAIKEKLSRFHREEYRFEPKTLRRCETPPEPVAFVFMDQLSSEEGAGTVGKMIEEHADPSCIYLDIVLICRESNKVQSRIQGNFQSYPSKQALEEYKSQKSSMQEWFDTEFPLTTVQTKSANTRLVSAGSQHRSLQVYGVAAVLGNNPGKLLNSQTHLVIRSGAEKCGFGNSR